MSPPPPEVVAKNRFAWFLIWQTSTSTTIYFFTKLFLLSFSATPKFSPSQLIFSLLKFLTFAFSNLLFSSSLSFLSSPKPLPSPACRRSRPLCFFVFAGWPWVPPRCAGFGEICSVCGGCWGIWGLSVVCFCGFDGVEVIERLGFRGFVFGVLYGLYFVYKKRWVLEFPIIQVRDCG